MKDQAKRAIDECRRIAMMTEGPGRITRRFLTEPIRTVHSHLRARMDALGLSTSIDAAGNLRGVWLPKNSDGKRILIGSHIDTVPDAGAFDGVLGVTLALELAEIAQEMDLRLGIEVIAFSEEEGVRFGVPFIGSRAVAGRFSASLLELKDPDGISIQDAIWAFGLDPDKLSAASIDENAIGFFELHIEQGPVLEAEGLRVAAVTGIVGQTRMSVEFSGQANHSGTTPMHLRHDALTATAEWITTVETLALKTEGLAATVGKMLVKPNAANVVAGSVEVSLDVRHISDSARQSAVERLLTFAGVIADRRGLAFSSTQKMDEAAVPMDERLTAYLTDAIEAAGFPRKSMPSGAGHDAMVMAGRVPAAMLFLRSPGGISHQPAETVLEEDVEAALEVGRRFLERLSAEVG